MEDLRYPIGPFKKKDAYGPDEIKSNIQIISALPSKLINLLGNWDEAKFDTPYRPEGWTVRQVVHHLADSHSVSMFRMRKALTENQPEVAGYQEAKWAELSDAKTAPVELSLQILKFVHVRWVMLLNSLTPEDLKRSYFHVEKKRLVELDESVAVYAWHSEHHYQHIQRLAQREKF